MAEYKTEKQVNYGWGLSLEMTGKSPAVAKRIFKTLSDAQAYADDINDSAIAGLQLSVIEDPDSSKNGVYFVKSIGDGTNAAVLELLGKGTESVDNSSIDLTEYAKTEDIQNWVIEQNYLTEHQDLSDYVVKTDIAEYAKTEDIQNWVEDQRYLTEHQDLSDYITKEESTSVIQSSVENTFDTYLNTHGFTARTVYLTETEWNTLQENVEAGTKAWDNNVIYMIYSDD